MQQQDPVIICPKCKAEIKLTESLAGPLVAATKAQAEHELQAALSHQRTALEDELRTSAEAAVKSRVDAAVQDAENAITAANELRSKLAVAQQAQAEAVRKERELADRERELNLTVETRINQALTAERTHLQREFSEENRLKLLEKDTLLESLQKRVEDLNQKLTQGSQQLQGEVQELDLEQQLRVRFPHDEVIEVAKGVNGADCQHVINAPSGARCGLILWESKRTKNWSDKWLPKLREDGRAAQADILVIVSAALPEELTTTFGCIDGVWICKPDAAMTLVMALRMTLLAVHNTKQVQAGMKSKSEEVYAYVTGPQFRHRVEALVEAFTTMQEDLTAEQKVTQRQWAKRAVQIERVMNSTSGMFGDLQGIAGKALPEPAGLALGAGGGE